MSRAYRSVLRYGRRRGLPTKAGFSRREMLKLGVMGAAAGLFAPMLHGSRANAQEAAQAANTEEPLDAAGIRVAVIGAGFGGLACAHTLARAGAEVTVFEATERVGGRVFSDKTFLEGRNVELGGEFIGSNHPTWIRLAEEFGLELVELDDVDGDDAIIFGGELVRGEDADELYEEIDEALAELIEMSRPIDPDRPYTSPRAEELDATDFAAWIESREMSERAKRLMHVAEAADNGVSTEQMSLLAYLGMVAGGGHEQYYELSETHRVDGGNDALAKGLANALEDRVKLASPVVAISRREDGATVRLDGGEEIGCDAVVLAIAPSVWDRIEFDPPLPEQLRPQMGRNTKLLLAVNKKVWETAGISPEIVADGPVSLTWVSSDGGEDGPHSFTLFSGAEAADALRNRNSSRRAAIGIDALRPAYPDLGDVVTKDLFLDWPGHPQTRASYSFPAPGEVTAFGPTLVEGLDDAVGRLFFAGEHTSYNFIGYMEGALSSGVRTAHSLAHQFKGRAAQ